MNQMIEVAHVTKIFRNQVSLFKKRELTENLAVDNISFSVSAGEFLGYLGPNGAGKSTTLKMLTGLLVPTSGTVRVNGFVPWKERTKYVKNIGAVFGQRSTLWWDLPVIDSLEMIRHMYEVPPSVYKKNIQQFTDLIALDELLKKPVRTLSLGQRMRAELCAALVYEPKLLFLDEPTIGLDLVAKDHIRTFLAQINKTRGTTIVLTTHDLSDVEKLCRSIIIIDRGQLVYQGNLPSLTRMVGGKYRLVADVEEQPEIFEISGADQISIVGKRITIEFESQNDHISEIMKQLTSRYTIRDIEVKKPEIERIVRDIYEKGKVGEDLHNE